MQNLQNLIRPDCLATSATHSGVAKAALGFELHANLLQLDTSVPVEPVDDLWA
jgi:hypothetical protein